MTHQQEIADRLAWLRRRKQYEDNRDITQVEMAEVIGATPETYSRYESGKRKVPDEAIFALAKFYGVTPGFIRYGETSTEAPIYLGRVSDEEAEAASRARAATLAAQREAARKVAAPDPPARKVAGVKRRRGNPRDGR